MVATLSSATMACASSDELGEENITTVQQAVLFENGIEPNGITNNGITNNGITNNGITNNGITNNGITTDVISALNGSALAQKFFTYLVTCALPPGPQGAPAITLTINGVPTPFYGGLGLAPQWGLESGSCDNACQELVSACMLARVNFYGDHVALSLRGNVTGLGTDSAERGAYPNREAAYWGNIFAASKMMYACKEHNSTLITRSCGPGITDSIMTVRGDCTSYCDAPDATDGFFANCKDSSGNPHPTITVYRQ